MSVVIFGAGELGNLARAGARDAENFLRLCEVAAVYSRGNARCFMAQYPSDKEVPVTAAEIADAAPDEPAVNLEQARMTAQLLDYNLIKNDGERTGSLEEQTEELEAAHVLMSALLDRLAERRAPTVVFVASRHLRSARSLLLSHGILTIRLGAFAREDDANAVVRRDQERMGCRACREALELLAASVSYSIERVEVQP